MTVALPLVAFGASLSTDVARTIIAARKTSNATEAAALAGAQQFAYDTDSLCAKPPCRRYKLTLDTGEAVKQAAATITEARNRKAIDTSAVLVGTPSVTTNSYGTQRVTVKVRYSVRQFTFLNILRVLSGSSSKGPLTFTVTRTADVCSTGTGGPKYGPTGGNCTRPTWKP